MADQLVKIFKALSDETRLGIVRDLLTKGEHSCNSFVKELPKSQPTLSHHFNKLIDANIIKARKEGVNYFYSINHDYLKDLGLDIQKTIKEAKNNG